MTEEKFNELLNDQAFRDEMNNAATLEDAAKIMQQHDIQITPEELQEIMAKMESESELNESELDDVAGGSLWAATTVGFKILWWWLKKHPHILPRPI